MYHCNYDKNTTWRTCQGTAAWAEAVILTESPVNRGCDLFGWCEITWSSSRLLEKHIRTKGRKSSEWHSVMADIALQFPQRRYHLLWALLLFYCTWHDTAAEVASKVKRICNLGCSVSRTVRKQGTRSEQSDSDWTTRLMHCLPYSSEIKYLTEGW